MKLKLVIGFALVVGIFLRTQAQEFTPVSRERVAANELRRPLITKNLEQERIVRPRL